MTLRLDGGEAHAQFKAPYRIHLRHSDAARCRVIRVGQYVTQLWLDKGRARDGSNNFGLSRHNAIDRALQDAA